MNKLKLLSLIAFILCMSFAYAELSKDITKDDIFKELLVNDETKKEAEFIVDNIDTKTLNDEALTINFNEVLGSVIDYKILLWQNCEKTKKVPIFQSVKSCFEGLENEGKICKNTSSIIGYETINYFEEDYCLFNDIPIGEQKFKIDAIIEWGSDFDGAGYKIDWIPSININTKDYINLDWAWWNASFGQCKNITITNTNSSTLTNIPVYIKLAYDSDMKADYSDIRFVSEGCFNDGSQLSHELEIYNATEAHFWVKVPSLGATDIISVYYGDASAADAQNVADVWSNGYVGVWHMSDLTESTGQCQQAFVSATPTPTNTSCLVGECYEFLTADSDFIDLNTTQCWKVTTNPFTIAHFFKSYDWVASNPIVSNSEYTAAWDGLHFELLADNKMNFYASWAGKGSTSAFGANTEIYATGTRHANQSTSQYYNGLWDAGSDQGADDVSSGGSLMAARNPDTTYPRYFNGTIDEIRLSNVTREADWINFTYQNMANHDTFISFGTEEIGSPPYVNEVPVVDNVTITPQSPNDSNELNCSSIGTDKENTTLDYIFYWEKDGVLQEDFNSTVVGQNYTTTYTGILVNAANLTAGDNWTCYSFVSDGNDTSANILNDTVNIAAAPINYNDSVFSCEYNPKPNIKILNKIDWICSINSTAFPYNSYRCYSYATWYDDIIQINPKQEIIQDVGIIDYFESQPANYIYQYVSVYFTTEDLRHNQPVNFSVRCVGNNETLLFEREVTPQIKNPADTIDFSIWLRDNAATIGFGLFLVLLFGIGFTIMMRLMKE